MPELPEVEAARRALEEHCVGKRIKKSTVADDSKVIDGVSSKDFEAALVGKTIVAAHRKGKNMWLQLDSPPFPSFQFGMAGALYIKGVAVTKYKRSAVKDTDEWPSKYSKVFVELDGGLEFSFTDKRRFAKVRLLDNPASVPPISELGPDALLEPMTVDRFYNSLTKKKIGIKALLLDQSFISGIGNWMADEVLYQSRTHPLQTASSMSKEACAALLKCINEVTEKAIEVGADSSQFPSNWIFHSREKKPGKAFVDGLALDLWKKIEFITAGSRTTAYVPELQKLTGNQAVKEAGKPSKRTAAGNSNADDESGDEDKPIEPKAVGGRKTGRTRKPSAMKKPSTSVSDSDDDEENSADDVTSKRKQGAKNPPARSKAKGLNENKGQRRQTKGRTAPAKRKHEESDHDTISSSGGDNEDQHEEAEEVMNGKRRGAGASSKKRVAISQNRKQKQNAK
ncbi:formamidopyrimidine-DNA glycosylase isoform X1 [Sesamum indicum]|uniref:Formamidopyrimidine-DNA glycosylase isoform X1 n=1 Tax=Sesamum indicum TaxID=4182 RepID=A0A6I9SSD8_SESIN|nr:formamidopyrimidine-DNA glycosylase isoform X1 [Sesamum indicum]